MGKKKDKTFSYNNTHGHGVYPPIVGGGQRYPHTDFHHNDPFWIYEELGILKDWLISLTKLGGMIAQMETNDANDIVNEYKALINKLKELIDLLYNSLYAVYQSETKFDSSLLNALELINGLTEYVANFISECNPLFNSLFYCIENRLVNDDKNINYINNNINNIYDSITNIWNAIENMASESTSSKTLTYGEDYSFNFYNGFYKNDNIDSNYLTRKDLQMDLGDSIYHSLEYNLTFGGYHQLLNDYVYNTSQDDGVAPIFSHGSNVDGRNYICDLIIKDGLADFSSLDSYNFIPQIWNMNPVSARARWSTTLSLRVPDSNTITIGMQAISDGFNQQYFYYINRGDTSELSFSTLAVDLTFTTHSITSK